MVYIKIKFAIIPLIIIIFVCFMNIISRNCREIEETTIEPQEITMSTSIVAESSQIDKQQFESDTETRIENEEKEGEATESEVETSEQEIESDVSSIVETGTHDNNVDGYSNYDVPSNNTIKSYMDFRCITNTNSRQYKLQKSLAYTSDCGVRMVGERYCVAVGSYYTTTIGQYIDIELENGSVIKGILADCKSDAHTDSTNRINPNGSVVEFVVDTDSLEEMARVMGDISYINDWNSKVVNIKVYNTVENF